MKTAYEIFELVNTFIGQQSYDKEPKTLYEPIRYVLSLGGKRIRPTLMLLAYNLYKDDCEHILPAAAALETYHNFTLLHDDLMDNADMRRGHATVHKKWDANTAILSGDTMLILAVKQMADLCRDDQLRPVLRLFIDTMLEIDEGQQYDMDFEQRNDVTEEAYLEMIRLKTSVLLACAMKTGALLADAPAEEADLLYRLGERVGLAFQLQDDYLDVYGDPKVFGKAIGGDIVSNKKTYMLINALNRANDTQRAELQRWIGTKEADAQEKIQTVTRLYNEMGIDRLARQRIEEHFNEARQLLDRLDASPTQKNELRRYINWMMQREK